MFLLNKISVETIHINFLHFYETNFFFVYLICVHDLQKCGHTFKQNPCQLKFTELNFNRFPRRFQQADEKAMWEIFVCMTNFP